MSPVEDLKAAILQIRAAAKAEGIEPGSTLGVWMTSQEMTLMVMAETVEWQTERLEVRLEQMGKVLDAETRKAKAATEATYAEAVKYREMTRQSEEARKSSNLKLAHDLSSQIADSVKDMVLIREIRFNERQNWSRISVVASIFLAVFVGGAIWATWWSNHAVRSNCIVRQVPDATGKVFYCPMSVVEGPT